jgi:hypothetical protein
MGIAASRPTKAAQSNAPIARRDDCSFSLSGRSPGSRAHARHAGESPSHADGAVALDSPSLVYRCGGSAGFGSSKLERAPASRFTHRGSWFNQKQRQAPDNLQAM